MTIAGYNGAVNKSLPRMQAASEYSPMCVSTHFTHLALLIVRLHDADMLLDAEADALLTEVEAAQAAREQGATDTQRRHLETIAGFVEALVCSADLACHAGGEVIATARNLAAQAS